MQAEFAVVSCSVTLELCNCARTCKDLAQEMSLLEQPIYRSIFSSIRVISEGKCQAGNLELTVILLKWDSPRINSVMLVLCNVHRPRFTPTVYHQVFSVSVDFKKSKHVFISANKNVFNNSIVSKAYNCYFLVLSAHKEKRVNGLPLLNMKVTLLTSLFITQYG